MYSKKSIQFTRQDLRDQAFYRDRFGWPTLPAARSAVQSESRASRSRDAKGDRQLCLDTGSIVDGWQVASGVVRFDRGRRQPDIYADRWRPRLWRWMILTIYGIVVQISA